MECLLLLRGTRSSISCHLRSRKSGEEVAGEKEDRGSSSRRKPYLSIRMRVVPLDLSGVARSSAVLWGASDDSNSTSSPSSPCWERGAAAVPTTPFLRMPLKIFLNVEGFLDLGLDFVGSDSPDMVMMLTAVMIVYRQRQDFVELVPLARLHFLICKWTTHIDCRAVEYL